MFQPVDSHLALASPPPLARIVDAAAAGDEAAWQALIARFTPRLRSVARGFRLSSADAEDVVQTTWLRAVTHIHRMHEPAAIGSWLVVTARREAMRHLQRGVPEVLVSEPPVPEVPESPGPEAMIVESERRTALRCAVNRLPERQRVLVDALLTTPGCTYQELSAGLRMPVGSIGPTRERGLRRLRRDRELARVVSS